ncbi:MAG: hypothetical protein IJ129_05855, partial [Ruminococcus sp.]|nr:hypothetical protein [Ruminococcus sp.]
TTVPAAESIAPESITNETYADQSGAAAAELPDVDDVPLEEPHTEVVDAADNGTSQEKSEFENSNTEKTDSNSEG